MLNTKNAIKLLGLLMADLDNDFMNQDFDRMTEGQVDAAYKHWQLQIGVYENLIAPYFPINKLFY